MVFLLSEVDKTTLKVDPLPCPSENAFTSPGILSANDFTIDKPRPVESSFLVGLALILTNMVFIYHTFQNRKGIIEDQRFKIIVLLKFRIIKYATNSFQHSF